MLALESHHRPKPAVDYLGRHSVVTSAQTGVESSVLVDAIMVHRLVRVADIFTKTIDSKVLLSGGDSTGRSQSYAC